MLIIYMDERPAKKLKATPVNRYMLKQGSEAKRYLYLPKRKRWVKATEMDERIVLD